VDDILKEWIKAVVKLEVKWWSFIASIQNTNE
jgi:hypothetical protein